MANRREHDQAAVLTGVAHALITNTRASAYQLVTDVIGQVIGARVGARLPDWAEPALHSHHRDVVHGVTFAGVATVKGRRLARRLRRRLLAKAKGYAERRASSQHVFDRLVLWFAEAACRLAAGIVVGVIPGYLSHLFLDAATPRGIPLLSAGIG